MSALDVFCWAVTIASIITVVIWGVVACFVLQGMFNLCRDVWRALRSKAWVAAHEREACARLQYEIDQLKRENSILRSEFKIWLVNNNIENYDMSEDAAEEDAERWLTHLVAHNEGAE